MREQRRQFYNDHKLQGYLITGLITIELLLVLVLLVYLYAELNYLIDERLYRIHGGDAASWPGFLSLLAKAVGGFLLVNAVILCLAHFIWDRYVKQTISLFSSGLDSITRLDFTAGHPARSSQHRIIDLLDAWRVKEQRRNHKMALLVDRLSDFDVNRLGAEETTGLRQILDDYRTLLISDQSKPPFIASGR